MNRTVVIDAFVEHSPRNLEAYATVAVDVIRASTTAVTAVSLGWECFPVGSLDAAVVLKQAIPGALLAGEIGGNMPYGFDLNNSPSEIAARTDAVRRLILLSSSGTRLMTALAQKGPAYVACFRNHEATARHLAAHHQHIAVIGAVTRAEFREEDQMCCAWIAQALIASGFKAEDDRTQQLVKRWSGAAPDEFISSKSVKYLEDSGQERDLDFVLAHFNDVNAVFALRGEGIVRIVSSSVPGNMGGSRFTGGKTSPEANNFQDRDLVLETNATAATKS